MHIVDGSSTCGPYDMFSLKIMPRMFTLVESGKWMLLKVNFGISPTCDSVFWTTDNSIMLLSKLGLTFFGTPTVRCS